MNKFVISLLLAACAASPALARDTKLLLPFQDVLDMPEAKEKLDGSVKFYLAGAKTPKVTDKKGSDTANRKTNGFNKSPDEGCKRAALSALIALQDRAKSLGANAVIDIVSFYKKTEFSSATEYECHDGAFVTGVALKGTFAKVAP
jgi:hypothetical protein